SARSDPPSPSRTPISGPTVSTSAWSSSSKVQGHNDGAGRRCTEAPMAGPVQFPSSPCRQSCRIAAEPKRGLEVTKEIQYYGRVEKMNPLERGDEERNCHAGTARSPGTAESG